MKSRRNYYIGISLVIVGIALFIFYFKTGKVFFFDFDEVTQIKGAKITSNDDYVVNGRYECMLITLSLLSFFSGVVILFIHNIRAKKR